jgi:chromosome segregation ATPase
MHQDVEKLLAEYGKAIQAGKEKKYRFQVRLEELARTEQQLLEEMKALGANPETVDAEIAALERQLKENLEKIEALMPADLLPR